ncbi:MAG: ester cyclase [Beijerinckiaceae bacterium]
MTPTDITAAKLHVRSTLGAIAESTPESVLARLSQAYHPQAEWRGSYPMNELRGVEAMAAAVWQPLLTAFPDLERRDTLLIGGRWNDGDWVGAVGHYCGTFRRDWLTIPATGRPIYIRYGEFHRVEAGKIIQSTVLMDVLDVIRQAGFWPIAPSLGTEEQWPCPFTGNGIVLTPQDPAVSAASLAQTLAMHKTLGDYNDEDQRGRDGLLAMPQKIHWHPKMMWYGPCGIGTTRSLQGFVDYHQLPFRIAFPNRRGGNHYVRIGDGAYSATAGWPSVYARHLGGEFLGVAPTGRDVTMRVMDFYLHHEGLIRENWVPIDIIHLLKQMDVDVFSRMRSIFRRGRLD